MYTLGRIKQTLFVLSLKRLPQRFNRYNGSISFTAFSHLNSVIYLNKGEIFMTALWIITGGVVGGGFGWLLGRFNSRNQNQQDCETTATPT
jgi:hypothetical protein